MHATPNLLTTFLTDLEVAHGPAARDAAAAMLGPKGTAPPDPRLLSEIRTFTAGWLKERGIRA